MERKKKRVNIDLGRCCIIIGAINSSSPIIIRLWSGIGHDRWLAGMKIRVDENGRAFGNIANDLGMNGGLLVIRMIGGIRWPIVILWTIAFGIGTRLLGQFCRVTAFTGARDYRRIPVRQRSGGRCGGGRRAVRIRARQLRTVPIRRGWQAATRTRYRVTARNKHRKRIVYRWEYTYLKFSSISLNRRNCCLILAFSFARFR